MKHMYERIDWNDKKSVENFVYSKYGKNKFSKLIIKTINRESSFDPNAKNKYSSAIGLMQITKICAKNFGYSYEDISNYPHLNLECGIKNLQECYKKAKKDEVLTYQLYLKGINNDELQRILQKDDVGQKIN